MGSLPQPPPSLCLIFIRTCDLNTSLESDWFPNLPSNITDTFTGSFYFLIIQYPVTSKVTKADRTLNMHPIICRTWLFMFLRDKSESFSRTNLNSGVILEALDSFTGNTSWAQRRILNYSLWRLREWKHWSPQSAFGPGVKQFLCVLTWPTTEHGGPMNQCKWWRVLFPCLLPT